MGILVAVLLYFGFSLFLFLNFRFLELPLRARSLKGLEIDTIHVPMLDDIISRDQPFFLLSNIALFAVFMAASFFAYFVLSIAIDQQINAAYKKERCRQTREAEKTPSY